MPALPAVTIAVGRVWGRDGKNKKLLVTLAGVVIRDERLLTGL